MSAPGVLSGHLEFLYGPEVAGAVLPDLLALIESFAARIQPRPPQPLTEQDVALITYGDMVWEPGRSPLASLGEFLAEHVSDVIDIVHILPFYPSSSDDGFSVIDYVAVDPALGDWVDVARMGESFQLMFDAVVNHISAKSAWFTGFCEGDDAYADFFTVMEPATDLSAVFRPRELPLLTNVETSEGSRHVWTTFSSDQIDLNYRNPMVLLAVIQVLLTYVARGADVIRLDAVTFLWKEPGTSCIHLPQTHRIIQLFRSVLDAVAPGVILITETNVPHEENVSYFGDGTNEADLVYNFALPPLTLHAFHTGDASLLSEWAAGVRAPSDTTTFFNFLASHDGIGVGGARGYLSEDDVGAMAERVEGLGGQVSYRATPGGGRVPYELNINYLDALGEPGVDESDELVARRFLTAHAVMLSLQGMPAVYFHSLFGSRGWPEGVAQTGAKRTVNREKLRREDIERELREPASLRRLVFDGFQPLLRARRSHRAFAPGADQRVVTLHPAVFAVVREDDDGSILCLHNVSGEPVAVDISALLGGPADDVITGRAVGRVANMRPYETLWLVEEVS